MNYFSLIDSEVSSLWKYAVPVPNPPLLSNSGALSVSAYHNGGKSSVSDAKKNHVRRGSCDDADEWVAPEKLKRNRYRSGQIRPESAPLQRRVGIDD